MVSQGNQPRDRHLTVALSEFAQRRLAQRAAAAGMSMAEFVSDLVERQSVLPPSLDEALRPVRESFAAGGMSDEELGGFLEQEIHAARAERRRRSP